MDDLGRILEDVAGESCYSDSDLSEQMREKIRTQAQRLRQLEQYRVLCEQRIRELNPGHSLPVKYEHLGQMNDLQNELKQAKNKIIRLETQIHNMGRFDTEESNENSKDFKFDRVLKEKIELEASLRAEMLVCEEQRAYIEVLKQALEEKSESPMVVKVDSRKNLKAKEDFRREKEQKEKIQKLENSEKKAKKEDAQRWKHLLQVKDNEIQELVNSKKVLENHLDQAGEALQIAEEEIAKLEEEKSNLLEYVDSHSAKEQEMEKEFNDLSQYFQSMKSEYDQLKQENNKTHHKLEQETQLKDKNNAKIEVLTEEIYKISQGVKDSQSVINELKSVKSEKDVLIKKLKEEKLAMEIKIENLQANSSTLVETLKETQNELEECEREVKELKKSEMSRIENLGKIKAEHHSLGLKNENLTEELKEIKKELEDSKKLINKNEKIKENDQKTLAELKANMLKFKAKSEELQEKLIIQSELEHLNSINEEKLSQLQEDLAYLQEEYREIQQRELLQSEALNDLRKHNSELLTETEELYRENQKLSIEYSQKAQDLHEYLKKFENSQKTCEALENTKKILETQLKSEKNLNKQLKDQGQVERTKAEELSKQLAELEENWEKKVKKVKILEEENNQIKLKSKGFERDLEEERIKRMKVNEDLKNFEGKVRESEQEFDRVQSEVIECYKVIAGFAGKYTVLGSDNRHSVSQGYKEFLLLWKDKISTNCSILASWVQNTVDEIENMSKQIFDLQKELGQSNNDLFKLTTKLEDVNCEDFCNKQEQTRLKANLDHWVHKYENLEKSNSKALNEVKLELTASQRDLGHLQVENNKLKDQFSKILNENQEQKKLAEGLKLTVKGTEQKIFDLKSEKSQLESFVKQMQRTFGTSEISKIYGEISRIKPELEVLERERLNFECQLLKYETDPRAKDSVGFKDLNSKLLNCERQIINYKKTLNMLQEDVNKEQMIQNLRLTDRSTLKNGYNNSKLPKSVSISNSRLVDSSKTLRNKSPLD